jgi:hypothetical protein
LFAIICAPTMQQKQRTEWTALVENPHAEHPVP